MKTSTIILLLTATVAVQCSRSRSNSPKKYNLDSIGSEEHNIFKTTEIGSIYDELGFVSSFLARSRSSSPQSASQPGTPRNSESGPLRRTFASIRESLFRDSFESDNAKGNNEDSPRTASSLEMPDLFRYVVDVRSVDEVDWDTLPSISSNVKLTDNQKDIITGYAEKSGHYDSEFCIKVHQTLIFISKAYPISPFVVNLAVYMVNYYPKTAPNALKKILDERFKFMTDPKWPGTDILTGLEPFMKGIKEWEILKSDPSFDNHIQSLFLDMLHGKLQAHDIMMIYMYIFYGSDIKAAEFFKRYALFLKTLIRLVVSDHENSKRITVSNLGNTLIFNSDYLEREIGLEFKQKTKK